MFWQDSKVHDHASANLLPATQHPTPPGRARAYPVAAWLVSHQLQQWRAIRPAQVEPLVLCLVAPEFVL